MDRSWQVRVSGWQGRRPRLSVFGTIAVMLVLASVLLRIWAASTSVPNGLTLSPGPGSGTILDVRPGSYSWLAGIRPSDSYETVAEDGTVLVDLVQTEVTVPSVHPPLPTGPAAIALLVFVMSLAVRLVLPAVGALGLVVAALVAGGDLLGPTPWPILVIPLIAPAAAVALLTRDRAAAGSHAARPVLVVMVVTAASLGLAVFTPDPPFTDLWQASRLVPIAAASVLALEVLAILAITVRSARRSREPASVAVVRSTAVGQNAIRLAVEEERDQAAQRVHDRYMTPLTRWLTRLADRTPSDEALVDDLRGSMMDDQLLVLREGGLVAGIEDVVQRCARHGAPGYVEVVRADGRSPWDVEVTALRITQEAVNNVLRHAVAESFVVRVTSTHRYVLVEIEDDGVGMTSERPADPTAHLGIRGMQARAREVHGRLDILTPSDGSGTLVRFQWPA